MSGRLERAATSAQMPWRCTFRSLKGGRYRRNQDNKLFTQPQLESEREAWFARNRPAPLITTRPEMWRPPERRVIPSPPRQEPRQETVQPQLDRYNEAQFDCPGCQRSHMHFGHYEDVVYCKCGLTLKVRPIPYSPPPIHRGSARGRSETVDIGPFTATVYCPNCDELHFCQDDHPSDIECACGLTIRVRRAR